MSDWTDQDKVALLALITRFVRMYDERKANLETIERLTARNASLSDDIGKLNGAFSVFGLSTKEDGWGVPIREAVGIEAWNDAIEAAGRPIDRSPQTDETQLASINQAVKPEQPSAEGTVREAALERLSSAGEDGTTAASIRDYIEEKRGEKLHYKTVGMTLYRLKEDGLARREGRTWFAVPQAAEKANPGGETPGPINRGT
jgi:hypothetical protein